MYIIESNTYISYTAPPLPSLWNVRSDGEHKKKMPSAGGLASPPPPPSSPWRDGLAECSAAWGGRRQLQRAKLVRADRRSNHSFKKQKKTNTPLPPPTLRDLNPNQTKSQPSVYVYQLAVHNLSINHRHIRKRLQDRSTIARSIYPSTSINSLSTMYPSINARAQSIREHSQTIKSFGFKSVSVYQPQCALGGCAATPTAYPSINLVYLSMIKSRHAHNLSENIRKLSNLSIIYQSVYQPQCAPGGCAARPPTPTAYPSISLVYQSLNM